MGRARKRRFSLELVERGELLNTRAIGEAVAQAIRSRAAGKGEEQK